MYKKLLSMILAFIMIFNLLPIQEQAVTVYAAEGSAEGVKTPIQKLVYTITASNLQENTRFDVVGAGWNARTETLNMEEQTQELTMSYDSSVDGIINMGFVYDTESGLSNSDTSITVEKITINDTYEILLDSVILNSNSNGLKNIWSGLSDGDIVYEGENCYFAFNEADQLIYFYVKSSSENPDDPSIGKDTRSMQYVKAMGNGWNLGNSLEAVNTNLDEPDKGEEAWGNPRVTKELIHSAKEKGFDSIRIPLTIYRRYTVKEDAGENEYKYVINEDYLNRAKEVIGWALEEDFYVMTNIHNDSWTWMEDWDGQKTSKEYRMFREFWKQLAETFKDASDKLCFETMNEYEPQGTGEITKQDKVMAMNEAAYDIIRNSGGNNKTRMIVMPSCVHNHQPENSSVLSKFIKSLDDKNLIATVHYYSEWVYASNIGKTGFDEVLWDDFTPRQSVDDFMKVLREQFLNDGIGVIVSEYGVLGYDVSDNCMQIGEEIKYYDYMNVRARENNVCLMFWDNGSAIDRKTYEWKYPRIGAALMTTMEDRIGYATGLDSLYFSEQVEEDVKIPLTLNGRIFTGIKDLTEGTDYTYEGEVIILSKDYINALLKDAAYGQLKDLEITFDNGYVWHEYLIYYGTPSYEEATGTKERIEIPFRFNGSDVRRITAYQASGRVGPNSDWWNWLKYGSTFNPDYNKGTLSFLSELLQDKTIKDGELMARIEFYDGQFLNVYMNVAGDTVTCIKKTEEEMKVDCAKKVVLYAGEKEIPSQYITSPDGYKVYGIYTEDESMVTMEGWPAIMTFDTKAHEDMTKLSIRLDYMNIQQRCDIEEFGIKDAPVVSPMAIKVGENSKVNVSNLDKDAVCTYKLSDTSIGTIVEDGTITALKEGTAVIDVTVEQYGRKDTFQAEFTVEKNKTDNNNNNNNNNNNSNNNNSTSNNTNSSSSTGNNNTGNTTDNKDNTENDNNTENNNNSNNNNNNNSNNTENNTNNEQQEKEPQPEKVGTIVKTEDAKGIFKVTDTDSKMPEVSYKGTKKQVTVSIPETITDANNIVYKVTSIAKNAFKGDTKVKTVVISNTIKTIGANAFKNCKNLKTVAVGNKVAVIENEAFYNCKKLKKIVIPKKVVKIGKRAFYNCKNLKTITIHTTKLTSKNVGKNALKGLHKNVVIKVPKSKLKAYKKLFKSRGVSAKSVISK